MRALRFHETGDIAHLQLEEVPRPAAGAGEALVRVAYAGLNPADYFLIQGQYPGAGAPPFTPGRDGCGTVEQPPAGSRFQPGQHVVLLGGATGISQPGFFADYVAVPEAWLAPLPEGWTPQEGAAAPLVYLTAWQALVDRGGLVAGENVLVTGASGGVGTAAVVLAKALGARVVATSRSADKRAALEQLGADAAIDSAAEDMPGAVRAGFAGGRPDLIVDNLGGPFLHECVKLAAPEGRIMVVGLLAGLKAEVTIGLLIHKCLRLQGLSVSSYTPEAAAQAWAGVVAALSDAGRCPLIDQTFPLDAAQEAFALLRSGPLGKVLFACQA